MKQETKRKIEISNLHEFADSLILIDNRIDRCKNIRYQYHCSYCNFCCYMWR